MFYPVLHPATRIHMFFRVLMCTHTHVRPDVCAHRHKGCSSAPDTSYDGLRGLFFLVVLGMDLGPQASWTNSTTGRHPWPGVCEAAASPFLGICGHSLGGHMAGPQRKGSLHIQLPQQMWHYRMIYFPPVSV